MRGAVLGSEGEEAGPLVTKQTLNSALLQLIMGLQVLRLPSERESPGFLSPLYKIGYWEGLIAGCSKARVRTLNCFLISWEPW